jgi:glycosyltransferase involved in cell wall biosynthesis
VPVRFFGPMDNHSGYGNAVKNFAKAFSDSNIKTKFIFPEKRRKKNLEFYQNLNKYEGKCNIDFYLHCPPYNRHKSDTYKIAYFYWEADRLPKYWNRSINKVDELWVPCKLVKDACIRAKFEGKIKIVPTPCDPWETKKNVVIPSSFSKELVVDESVYKFYSIFQWHNRKGYKELLNSYYKTFKKDDNVLLILKVNALNIAGYTRDLIKPDILEIKRKLNLKYYPPVFLMTNIIPNSSIRALHNTADCYISPHHGEGWGMPIHDAMRMGKQIITTKYGGVTEYLDNKSAHIIKHSTGPVHGMDWSPLYGRYQNWAYPSINHLSKLMRDVYHNHEAYKDKELRAKQIANTMTIDKVSKIINKEISRIGQ